MGVSKGILISSNSTIIKVEECRLEHTRLLFLCLLQWQPQGITGGPTVLPAGDTQVCHHHGAGTANIGWPGLGHPLELPWGSISAAQALAWLRHQRMLLGISDALAVFS